MNFIEFVDDISHRITTPSIDSGNPSESSPLQVELDDGQETKKSYEHDLKIITKKICQLGNNYKPVTNSGYLSHYHEFKI